MTPEEKAVIQAAIRWEQSLPLSWVRIVGSPEDILNNVTQRLIYNCVGCNTETHRCGGCGENIQHGDTDCGKNCTDRGEYEKCDASTYPCWECTIDEDPAPWCDCQPDDFGATSPNHACRLRAHDPSRCLNNPNRCPCDPAKPMRCAASDCHGGNEVPQWFLRTWADVVDGDRVRLPGMEITAEVASAVRLAAHVDPRSSEYQPQPLEWTYVAVRFEGGDTIRQMDPAKPVEILLSPAEVEAIETIGWPARVAMIQEPDSHQGGTR